MTDYILCTFVDEFHVGDKIAEWPLHITIVPWFVPEDRMRFSTSLRESLAHVHPLQATVGEVRVWGEHTVNVMEFSQSLHDLHARLLKVVTLSGKIVMNEHYTATNYVPHITQQPSARANLSDEVVVRTIYLIQRESHPRQKTIIDKIELV